jgi:ABC-type bacteriocin/lantibiotic exporter with double-glycine peptidase domain
MIANIVLVILLLIASFISRFIAEDVDNENDATTCNVISFFLAICCGYFLAQIIIELV